MANSKTVFAFASILYLCVAIFNHGFIAVDDYASNIEVVVPAQSRTFRGIIDEAGFRPPFANVFMGSVTKVAYQLGILHPKDQLIFLRIVIAMLGLSIVWISINMIFQIPLERSIAFPLVCFYFLSPLLLTRPLIEGMSAPWLLLSAAYCVQFRQSRRSKDVALSVLALTLATMIRYQSGLCLIGLLFIVISIKNWGAIFKFAIFSLCLFGIVGLCDWALRGRFHASLISYVNYNRMHSASYGVVPFYSYVGLLSLLSIFPLWLGRYPGFPWASKARSFSPLICYLVAFVGFHSFVGHKEERFMIPILPVFLCLFVPLFVYLIQQRAKMRLALIMGTNILLLIISVSHMPQRNIIGVAKFVDEHPEIGRVVGFRDTLAIYPRALVNRKVSESRVETLYQKFECDSVIAVRKGMVDVSIIRSLEKIAEYSPGLAESLVISLNPKKNFRRGSVELWRTRECPGFS